jgi:serine/threonine-protein kinase
VAQERLFSLPAVVRECAWKQVPTATRRLLQRRLAECCIEWLPEMHSRPDDCPPLFASLEQAMPFLKLTADWVLAQEPTPEFPAFLNLLRHYGLVAPLEPVAVYLSLARQDETLSPEARMYAASCAAYAFMEIDQHAQAVAELEAGLPLAASTSADDMLVSLHSTLMMACHYAGDSDAAVAYGGLVLTHHREQSNFSYVASCLRFLGEIHNHLERFEQALAYCEEAVDLTRTGGTDSAGMADALYWKAKSLFRLQRYQEASDTIEETLSLWQEVGDVTGVGFCLRLIGQIRCVEGRYAEARTHLEHAVALHERTGSAVNRIAAVEALGDVLRAAQRYEEAQTHYEECLAFFTEKQHIVNVDRLKSQLEACSALPPGRE